MKFDFTQLIQWKPFLFSAEAFIPMSSVSRFLNLDDEPNTTRVLVDAPRKGSPSGFLELWMNSAAPNCVFLPIAELSFITGTSYEPGLDILAGDTPLKSSKLSVPVSAILAIEQQDKYSTIYYRNGRQDYVKENIAELIAPLQKAADTLK